MFRRVLALLLALASPAFADNLILNGSFEDFTVDPGCYTYGYGQGSAEDFAAAFPHVHRWGVASLRTTTNGTPCGTQAAPQDGVAKVRTFIYESPAPRGGQHSGVIFELSEPLETGTSYVFRGWAFAELNDDDWDAGRLTISLSEEAPPTGLGDPTDSFGENIGTLTPPVNEWGMVELVFEAPFAARYLGVQTNTFLFYSATNLDNFSLTALAVPTRFTSWSGLRARF